MKKHLLTNGLVALLLAVTLSGCSGLLDKGTKEVQDTSINYNQMGTINCEIENYSEIIKTTTVEKTASKSRLVAPTVTADSYDFYLYGINGKTVCGPYQITNMTGSSGSFSVSIPQGAWNLTLVAWKQGATAPTAAECRAGLADDALLMGSAYVDLSKYTTKAKFILSPEGLSKVGNIDLAVILDGWTLSDHVGKDGDSLKDLVVKGALYNLTTGQKDADTEVTLTFAKDDADGDKATYKVTGDIAPGTYNFAITFDNGNDVNWQWSDKLMVFPGSTTDTPVYISEIIKAAPKAPEFLMASVKTDSGKPVLDTDARNYAVIFDWADWDSDGYLIENETNFELQVADISGIDDKTDAAFALAQATSADGLAAATAVFWEDAVSSTPAKITYKKAGTKTTVNPETYSIDVMNNKAVYVSGSLLANNKQLVLNLELGKEYAARIRSVNKAGKSAWTYCLLTGKDGLHATGVAKNETPAGTTTVDPKGTVFEGKTINTYAIRYWLNGGNTETPVAGEYYVEYGPKSAGVRYWDAYGAKLKKSGVLISSWKDAAGSTANEYQVKIPVAAATTYSAVKDLSSGDLYDAGYKNEVTRTTETVLKSGIKVTEVCTLHTKKTSVTSPVTAETETSDNWTYVMGQAKTQTKASAAPLDEYTGYANLDLYAAYETEYDWQMVTAYTFTKDNITYAIGDYDGTDFDSKATGTFTGTNAVLAEHDPEKGNYIEWSIKTPSTEWNYRYIKVTVKAAEDTNEYIDRVETSNLATPGEPNKIVTNVTQCVTGSSYRVLIEVGLPNSALSATVPVILDVK